MDASFRCESGTPGSLSHLKHIANYIWMPVVASVLTVLTSSSSYAQGVPKTEVSFGYQWQHISRCDGTTTFCNDSFPAGWYFDASGGISRMVGLVGLLDGSYKAGAFAVDPSTSHFNIHTYGGGVRVSGTSKVTPFAQFLVGGIRRMTTDPFNRSDLPLTETAFMIDMGAGMNVPAGTRWGLRVGVDYRRGFFNLGSINNVRLNVGAVVRFN